MNNLVKYLDVAPFSFYDMTIRELSPKDYAPLSLAEVTVPAGSGHPTARSTRSDKLYICSEGAVAFQLNGETLQLSPRDVVLIPKGEWFSYQNDGGEEAKMLLLHTPPFDMDYEEFSS